MLRSEFPADKTYANLYSAVTRKQYKKIESLASDLKSISEELGFLKLESLCDTLVTSVRIHCYKGIPNTFRELEAEYRNVIRDLRK